MVHRGKRRPFPGKAPTPGDVTDVGGQQAEVSEDLPPGASWCRFFGGRKGEHRLHCPVCEVTCSSVQQWIEHRQAEPHRLQTGLALLWKFHIGWVPVVTSRMSSFEFGQWELVLETPWPQGSEQWFKDDLHSKVWDPDSQTWEEGSCPDPATLEAWLKRLCSWLVNDSGKPWVPFECQQLESRRVRVWPAHGHPQSEAPPAWITFESWVALRRREVGKLPGVKREPFPLHALLKGTKMRCPSCGTHANGLQQLVDHFNSVKHRHYVLKRLYLDHFREHLRLPSRRTVLRLLPQSDEQWPEKVLSMIPTCPELGVFEIVHDQGGCPTISRMDCEAPDRAEQQAIIEKFEEGLLPHNLCGEQRAAFIVSLYGEEKYRKWSSRYTPSETDVTDV